MSRRPLFTPTRAVCGLVLLAALVVGGLAWVSVAALRVERAERQAVARADVNTRERLALWRLDSHMISPLVVENNRPISNYLSVAPPAPLVLDAEWQPLGDPGRSPSPLLSVALPEWMRLHFQLDSSNGWTSPQVPAADVIANLQGELLGLDLPNCNPVRTALLDTLRTQFPVDPAIRSLTELDRQDPDTAPFVVPVSQADEPAVGKPASTVAPAVPLGTTRDHDESPPLFDAFDLAKRFQARDNAQETERLKTVERPKGDSAVGEKGARRDANDPMTEKKDGTKPADAPTPAPSVAYPQLSQAPPVVNGMNGSPFNIPSQKANFENDSTPETKARKGTADQAFSTRGGYEPQFGGGRVGTGLSQNSGSPLPSKKDEPSGKQVQAAGDAKKQGAGGGQGGGVGVGGPPMGGSGGFGGVPGGMPLPTPQVPGGGGPAQPPSSTSGAPPLPAEQQQQKVLDEQSKNMTDLNERIKSSQGRNRSLADKDLRNTTDTYPKAKETPTRNSVADEKASKGGKGDSARLLAEAKSAGPLDAVAEAKAPPFVALVPVQLGPLRPRWLTAADGTEHLLLVRAAATDTRVVYQGVVADWPTLHRTLTALVTDLFPNAKLVPLRGEADEAPPERTMTTLPVRLDTGHPDDCGDCGWTPLRFGLVIAWAAAVLAILATAVGGRAVVAMSERRVRFASAVTHELRTPLTALQLHLDLLNSGLITDEAKKAEYLTTIAAEADRLNRLVENVLDFARLEKTASRTVRPVPTADLLDAVRRTWADRLRADGFDLITDTTSPPNQAVLADPRVLEQVLGNLIDNARKYAAAAVDRRIWVRLTPADGGKVAVTVEDRGPGVPTGERRTIFQPFTRGSGSTATGGAGLGLSLAKEWAELFGGSLVYRPAEGGTGACFRLELRGGERTA